GVWCGGGGEVEGGVECWGRATPALFLLGVYILFGVDCDGQETMRCRGPGLVAARRRSGGGPVRRPTGGRRGEEGPRQDRRPSQARRRRQRLPGGRHDGPALGGLPRRPENGRAPDQCRR